MSEAVETRHQDDVDLSSLCGGEERVEALVGGAAVCGFVAIYERDRCPVVRGGVVSKSPELGIYGLVWSGTSSVEGGAHADLPCRGWP